MTTQLDRAAALAARWWADRLKQGDGARLITVLQPKIRAELEKQGRVYLENDYDPKGILLDTVREIGIECRGCLFSGDGIFPRKHSLYVYPDRLEPKEGYGHWVDLIPVLPTLT